MSINGTEVKDFKLNKSKGGLDSQFFLFIRFVKVVFSAIWNADKLAVIGFAGLWAILILIFKFHSAQN